MSWTNARLSRRGALTALGAAAALPLVASCDAASASGAEFTMVAAHTATTEHFHHRSFLRFKELVEADSDGRIEVKVFPNGVFGGDRELTEAVQLDNIQLASPAASALAAFSPGLNVWDIPFLFDDRGHAARVLDSPFGMDLLGALTEVRLIGLGYWENGFRNITTNSGDIAGPGDMQGVKIRTMESPTQIRAWNATGASATPMAVTEVYTGLQQGTIDAQENPLPLIASQKFYEVQQNLVLSAHLYSPNPLLLSKTFFDGLPADLQDVVLAAGTESTTYCREESAVDEREAEQIVRDAGVTVTELDATGHDEFRSIMQGAATPYVRELVGDEPVDELFATIEEQR